MKKSDYQWLGQIVGAANDIRTPLAFFGIALLIAGIVFVKLAFTSSGQERVLAIVGALVLLILLVIGMLLLLKQAPDIFRIAPPDAGKKPAHEREGNRSPTTSKLQRPEKASGTLVLLSQDTQDLLKNSVIRSAVKYVEDSEAARAPWSFHEIKSVQELDDSGIELWNGIFLAMPYGQRLDDNLVNRLVKWVRNGGNLVLSCFELGERHHGSNINQLAYHFGIAFNSDVIVRPDFKREGDNKDYDAVLVYDKINKRVPDMLVESVVNKLFERVNKLALRNACSLHLEPGASTLVYAAPNTILELEPEAARYSKRDGFHVLAAGRGQRFEEPYLDNRRVVIALASKGLTEKGLVLAMGTWDFRSDGIESDNTRFLQNIWQLLIS
jgi:hypothetical protein